VTGVEAIIVNDDPASAIQSRQNQRLNHVGDIAIDVSERKWKATRCAELSIAMSKSRRKDAVVG
jgi:hypothetical protein